MDGRAFKGPLRFIGGKNLALGLRKQNRDARHCESIKVTRDNMHGNFYEIAGMHLRLPYPSK